MPSSRKTRLNVIPSLVAATIHTLDDALLPTANWVLKSLDVREEIERVIGLQVTSTAIASFQDTVAKPFINDLKNNITSRFKISRRGVIIQHF